MSSTQRRDPGRGRLVPRPVPRGASPAALPSAGRLTVRRVRLRSVARVGCSLGWLISLLPALLTSALAVWVLHGIWSTLNGWTPWTPWPRDTRLGPFALPTPEFRPREALHLEGIYRL